MVTYVNHHLDVRMMGVDNVMEKPIVSNLHISTLHSQCFESYNHHTLAKINNDYA